MLFYWSVILSEKKCPYAPLFYYRHTRSSSHDFLLPLLGPWNRVLVCNILDRYSNSSIAYKPSLREQLQYWHISALLVHSLYPLAFHRVNQSIVPEIEVHPVNTLIAVVSLISQTTENIQNDNISTATWCCVTFSATIYFAFLSSRTTISSAMG